MSDVVDSVMWADGSRFTESLLLRRLKEGVFPTVLTRQAWREYHRLSPLRGGPVGFARLSERTVADQVFMKFVEWQLTWNNIGLGERASEV